MSNLFGFTVILQGLNKNAPLLGHFYLICLGKRSNHEGNCVLLPVFWA